MQIPIRTYVVFNKNNYGKITIYTYYGRMDLVWKLRSFEVYEFTV
jgi:hypothetical protein